jgi:hypothetical protein
MVAKNSKMNEQLDPNQQRYRLTMAIPTETVEALQRFCISLVQAIHSILPPTLAILDDARKRLGFDLEELKALAVAEKDAIDRGLLDHRTWDRQDLELIVSSLAFPVGTINARIRSKVLPLFDVDKLESRILTLALLSGLETVRAITDEFVPEYVDEESPEPDASDEIPGDWRTVEEAIEIVFGVK